MKCSQTISSEAGVLPSMWVTMEFFWSPWSSARKPAIIPQLRQMTLHDSCRKLGWGEEGGLIPALRSQRFCYLGSVSLPAKKSDGWPGSPFSLHVCGTEPFDLLFQVDQEDLDWRTSWTVMCAWSLTGCPGSWGELLEVSQMGQGGWSSCCDCLWLD